MVDYNRALLDELMGRNRDLDPASRQNHKISWTDPEFCTFYMVKFCPHDLFVNTRADLGSCPKLHDEEAKKMYEESKNHARKAEHEDEFLRFCSNMINEVDRKIIKGRQRLDLMNSKLENRPVSKQQDQVNNLNEKIKKLVREAEEAGIRGDVEQAQNLMLLCDQLKEDKDALIKQYEQSGWNVSEMGHQEKQMEVCDVCGAFLIVGDAQQRIDDHLTGKQHIGYTKLRRAVEEFYEKRRKDRDENGRSRRSEEDRRRDDRSRSYRYDRRDRDRHHRDREYRDRHRSRSRESERTNRKDRSRERNHRRDRDRRSRSNS